MLNNIKLYLLYRRIKRRGWAKNKSFREWKIRREWVFNITSEERKALRECREQCFNCMPEKTQGNVK